MVFSSSVPVYLDPPNWQQHNHQQGENNPQFLPPLAPPPHGGGGSGGGGSNIRPGSMADRARLAKIPQPETALKCPRCESTNTKFCYFNNYSLSQPRHFCKTCRRYWTRGGALRNVPVGGGCRRNNKKSKTKSPASASASASADHLNKQVIIGSNSTDVNVIPSDHHHHLPHQQTPANNLPSLMASLQSFPQFSLGNIGLNFGGNIIQGGGGADNMGFQIGGGGQQQYSLFDHQPIITNNNGLLYPFQMSSEGMEGGPSSSRVSHEIGAGPAVKMENSHNNRRSVVMMGVNSESNKQLYWAGGGNSTCNWTDLSGLNNSST